VIKNGFERPFILVTQKQMSGRGVESALYDPSLGEGGECVFDKEIPVEIRSWEGEESEAILVRIKVIIHAEDGGLRQLRIELTSENDVFFLYESTFTAQDYADLQSKQKLKIDFDRFPQVLVNIIAKNVDSKGEFTLAFLQDARNHGVLIFQQNLQFKSVEIFSLEFVPAQDEFVRDQIQFRYNLARSELKAARAELSDLYSMLKIKNPSVLKQMRTNRK
jgi:hypothetical protein